MSDIVLTTGVREKIGGEVARVVVANLHPSASRTVTVSVFDWGAAPGPSASKPVVVNPAGPVALESHASRSFTASIAQSKHYEIRITLSDADNVIANCFEIDSNSHFIPTVSHAELVPIGGLDTSWWTNAETFAIGVFAIPFTYANGVFEWGSLAESKVTFITHCPIDKEFIARCHAMGIRCFPYVVFYCGADQVSFREGTKSDGAPVLPMSDTYEGVNFGSHPEYFEYEPDPQHPGQYRARPWMFVNNPPDGDGVFFSNPLVTCPNVQAYQDAMVKWVDYVMRQGADGVFVDCMFKRLHCDGPAAGKHAHIVAEVANDPDAAQNHAYAQLLKRVRGVVKRHRPDGLLIGNSGDPLNLIGNSPPEFQQYIDADMFEGYICQTITDPQTNASKTVRASIYQAGPTWDQLGRLLQPYIAGGKQVLAISPIGQPSDHSNRDDAFFCYASARLAGITWYGAMSDPTVVDLFRIRLGEPLTAELNEPPNAAPPACVFFRVFERALVAVNPDPANEHLLTIHPPIPTTRFYDLYANASVDATPSGTLRIPANSGRVFLFGSTTSFGLNVQL